MERGVGGRIEDAFAAAKEQGEAAFVTFVTAGYPTAAGMYTSRFYSALSILCFLKLFCF
jgi:tryptophan synthase alpha subunit